MAQTDAYVRKTNTRPFRPRAAACATAVARKRVRETTAHKMPRHVRRVAYMYVGACDTTGNIAADGSDVRRLGFGALFRYGARRCSCLFLLSLSASSSAAAIDWRTTCHRIVIHRRGGEPSTPTAVEADVRRVCVNSVTKLPNDTGFWPAQQLRYSSLDGVFLSPPPSASRRAPRETISLVWASALGARPTKS